MTGQPIRIGGYDINCVFTADHFWIWERMALNAQSVVHSNPGEAWRQLDQMAKMFASAHATARKDDPKLPSYYRSLLEVAE